MFLENEIKISTDKKDVIFSGTVFQFEKEDVIFHIPSLEFRLSFVSDDGNPRAEGKYDNEKQEFCIQLYNYDNSLGVGLTKPMNIGSINDKKLYFICRVTTLSKQKENHLIHYTFFVEK